MNLQRWSEVDIDQHGRGLFVKRFGREGEFAIVYVGGAYAQVPGGCVRKIPPKPGESEFSKLVAGINAARKAGLVTIRSSGLLTALTPDVEMADGSVRMLWGQLGAYSALPGYYNMFRGWYTVYRGAREILTFNRDNDGAYTRALRLIALAIKKKEAACDGLAAGPWPEVEIGGIRLNQRTKAYARTLKQVKAAKAKHAAAVRDLERALSHRDVPGSCGVSAELAITELEAVKLVNKCFGI